MSPTSTTEKNRYIEAVGRRKTATARVRLTPTSGKTHFKVNDREMTEYFKTAELQYMATESLKKSGDLAAKMSVEVQIMGGGIASQAEAVRLGIARAMSAQEPTLRIPLKQGGMLSRDQRAKERRKFGLKKARKAPQWSKR